MARDFILFEACCSEATNKRETDSETEQRDSYQRGGLGGWVKKMKGLSKKIIDNSMVITIGKGG